MENKSVVMLTENSNKSSSRSNKKKSDILPMTIIASLERDINELLQEINIRTQRNKLISMNETLKILAKKIDTAPIFELSPIIKPKEQDIENIKKSYEEEIKKLKDDRDLIGRSSTIEYERNMMKKDEMIKKLNQKIEEMNIFLSEERNDISEHLLRIKILEESLKKLDIEYESLLTKYTESLKDNEKFERVITDMKRINGDNKHKFEDLVTINKDLKEKIITSENSIRLHSDELKTQIKKNTNLQKQLEEIIQINKQLESEMQFKEERLKVIRHMNTKLEQKASQIMKKWDQIKIIEERNSEENSKSQHLIDTIEAMTDKINKLETENLKLKNFLDECQANSAKSQADLEDYKKQIILLKLSNEEINQKNNELENKFKRSLEQQVTKTELSKKNFNSAAMKSLTEPRNTESIDDMRPAKLRPTKGGLEVNY